MKYAIIDVLKVFIEYMKNLTWFNCCLLLISLLAVLLLTYYGLVVEHLELETVSYQHLKTN